MKRELKNVSSYNYELVIIYKFQMRNGVAEKYDHKWKHK